MTAATTACAVRGLCRCASLALALALVSAHFTGATAQVVRAGVELPATFDLGGKSLALAGCGVRDTLWIEHYVAALYLLPGAPVTAAMRDAAQPKAILMYIVREASLPDWIPEQWRDPLRDELRRDPLSHVRAAYSALASGDSVWVTYTPAGGLTMAVNEKVVARLPNHDLLDSMLRTWADGDPLSGKLQRLLLENPC